MTNEELQAKLAEAERETVFQKAIVLAGRYRVAICTLGPAKPLIDMNRIAGYGRAKGPLEEKENG